MMTTLLFVTLAIVNAQTTTTAGPTTTARPATDWSDSTDVVSSGSSDGDFQMREIDLTPAILGTYTGPEADKDANLAKALAAGLACATEMDLDTPEKQAEVLKKTPEEQYQLGCDAQDCLFTKWEDAGILGSDGVYSGNFAICELGATLYRDTCEIDCTRAGAGEIFVMPILTLLALLI